MKPCASTDIFALLKLNGRLGWRLKDAQPRLEGEN